MNAASSTYNNRILIVDDTPQNLHIVSTMLEADGYCVASALNGKAALEMLAETEFDLVLLDVMMPGMNGFEVCERLKANPRTASIPVVFLTASSDMRSVVRAFETGGVDFISKPFNDMELLARVRTHLSLSHSQLVLEEREAILSAVSYAAKYFLEEKGWQNCLPDVLDNLAQAAKADAAYMFCNPDSQHACAELLNVYLPYEQVFNLAMLDKLRSGETLYGAPEFFCEQTREYLEQHGVCSLLIVPVFVAGEWWGALVFEDHKHPPHWGAATLSAFKTAASTLGAALKRNQTEDALWRSQVWVSTFLDNIDDLVCFRELNGTPSHCNPAYERLTGYGSAAFQDAPQLWLKLVHPHERDAIEDLFNRYPDGTQFFETEYRLQAEDGSWRWLHARMVGMRDPDGNYIGYHCIERDVTERRRNTEERLLQAAIVFENTAEAIVVTDSKCNINAVNRAFSEITGYQEEDVIGKNPRFLKSDRHDRSFYETLWACIKETGFWQGEIWNRRKNGDVFPVWQNITRVRDDNDSTLHYVSIFTDITERKISEERIRYLAHHDVLTELPNRLLFNDRVEHALDRARDKQRMLALMFLDLDHFKHINDSLGHPVGDQLLKEVAKRLKECLCKKDTVARLGGDEFTVLLEDLEDAQPAANLAVTILQRFNTPFLLSGHTLYLTPSIGISLFPQDGQDADTLIRNADAAMYRAKEQGRNAYEFYTTELTNSALERLQLESHLRRARELGHLFLMYQPQVTLSGEQQLLGAEALLRWQHPLFGLVPPDKFIPLAEDTGLILSIGEWVLTEACKQLKRWQDAGLEMTHISVNVSFLQVQRGDLVRTVSRVLQETGLEPRCLELEITESVIMNDPQQTADIFASLQALGVYLAIDDFGTGYSSLAYLRKLPINRLKIDRSFVCDLAYDNHAESIAKAIIALAKSLQLGVVAEGVETPEQERMLEAMGCEHVQGYLYSPPLNAKKFSDYLSKQLHQSED